MNTSLIKRKLDFDPNDFQHQVEYAQCAMNTDQHSNTSPFMNTDQGALAGVVMILTLCDSVTVRILVVTSFSNLA